jgi:membrane-associated phospholipid phosphatase
MDLIEELITERLEHAPAPRSEERAPLRLVALWMIAAAALFEALYAGANAVTSLHQLRVPIAFAWEHGIPFAPGWVVAYWSLWPMVLLAPALLPTKAGIQRLVWAIVLETALAAVLFVLIPAETAYAPETVSGGWRPAYELTQTVSMSHNLFPSLHVAFAVTFATTYARGRGLFAKVGFGAWAALIAASTLLLHLHHVVDLLGGALLAWAVTTYARVPRWAFDWGRP